MNSFKNLLQVLLLAPLTLANPLPPTSSSSSPLEERQTNLARITGAVLSGSGCPSGTFSTEISIDGQAITLGFDSYQTLTGPDTTSSDHEKNCDLLVTLTYPLGCTTATLGATYHGFAQLEPDVVGTFTSQYFIAPGSLSGEGSSPGSVSVTSNGFGGNGNVYTKVDEPIVARVNARNQGQRNVGFFVRTALFLQANSGTPNGLLTQDDVSVAISSQARC